MPDNAFEVEIRAITPIWTGGIDRKKEELHPTGIIGSLRWWYESIVRGLDEYACDPSEANRCGFKQNQQSICPVCHLFGCTGWQRKFRLEIREEIDGKPGSLKKESIKANDKLWLCFTQLKPITSEEKALLYAALSISSRYGAIGGKTVYKPSEILQKNYKEHHKDYGLFEIITPTLNEFTYLKADIKSYLQPYCHKENLSFWPDLRYFWFAPGKTLNRIQLNKIVGRSEDNPKEYLLQGSNKWLGGEIRDSKKIFAFHHKDALRIFGYLKNEENAIDTLNDILHKVELKEEDIKLGKKVLNEYFQ